MVATADDISIVLSGGSVNTSTSSSIGGDPSNTPINFSQTLGNLFDDITPEENEDGYEDYRCFYVFNDASDPVYDLKIWVTEETEEGSYIEVGIQDQDEVQRLTITGTPNGGSFEIAYGGVSYVSAYNADLGAWAEALQDGLNNLEDEGVLLFSGIAVTAQNTSTGIVFDIQFSDYDGKRIQDEFTVESSLTPGSVATSMVTLQEGSPINTIAPEIGVETTTPGSVNFFVPSEDAPIELPRLESGEGFPIWIRRVVDEGATAVANDGFSLKIRMKALKAE